MIELEGVQKKYIKEYLRSYLEEDNIKGLFEYVEEDKDNSNYENWFYSDIYAFLVDLGIPLLENIGDSIVDDMFIDSSLTSIHIPPNIKVIGDGAFNYCANLSDVTFSDGLKHIGSIAFVHCHSLGSIEFPASLNYLGGGAFEDTRLSNVTFNSDARVNESAFYNAGCPDIFFPKQYIMGAKKSTRPRLVDFYNCCCDNPGKYGNPFVQ